MPEAKWPNDRYLNPPRTYDTCWRCGIRIRRDYQPRTCTDCRSLLTLASERGVWARAS